MASPGEFNPTESKPRPRVLPPIGASGLSEEVEKATSKKKELEDKLKAQQKLLKHRRSKVQENQLHMKMVSRAMKDYRQSQESNPVHSPLPEPQLPSTMISEEREKMMNYSNLKRFVESRPQAPIQQQWLDSIVARVPDRLKETPEMKKLLEELCVEVSEEFHNAMVKHTVDFVLKNPQQQEQSSVTQTVSDSELLHFSKPWHDSFVKSREMIKAHLQILHPVMQTLLDLGFSEFSELVLVDPSTFRALGPLEYTSLKNKADMVRKEKEVCIMNTWYPKIIHLLSSEKTQKKVKAEKMDAFYNCASTLISNQLKSMLQANVEKFVRVFDPNNQHRLLVFRMALTFDDEKMEIFPTLQDLEDSVLEILNAVANTLQKVQILPLGMMEYTSSSFVDASLPDELLTWAQATLKNAVRKNLEEPDQLLKTYVNKYDWLVNGTAQSKVDTFLEEEHSFDEYKKQVEEFHMLSKEISSLPSKHYFPMVLLDSEELKQGIANKAKMYADVLLKKVVTTHREQILLICSEFEVIQKKALEVPENTENIAQIEEYIKFTRTTGIAELNEKIKEALSRLLYLLDNYFFDPEDLELNSTVFLWPKNISHAFEQNDEVLQTAKEREKKKLIGKREKLMAELETLGRRVEQFLQYRELDSMQQYVEDIRKVQKLVQMAEEAIAQINNEEAFYKWDITCYPEVEVLKEGIEPYQKLFGFILKWQHTENRWMDGSFLELDGESMEVQVEEFYREIFKMLTFFQQKQVKAVQELEKISGKARGSSSKEEDAKKQDSPTLIVSEQIKSSEHIEDISGKKKQSPGEEDPKNKESPTVVMCSTVMNQIKTFKDYIPVVSILCNPCIRTRHWHLMSEIVGYDLTPNSGTSLRKVLNENLAPYLNEFQSISVAASKEFSMEKTTQM